MKEGYLEIKMTVKEKQECFGFFWTRNEKITQNRMNDDNTLAVEYKCSYLKVYVIQL